MRHYLAHKGRQTSLIEERNDTDNVDKDVDTKLRPNQDIALSTFCIIAPVLVLTVTLLGYIHFYRVDRSTIRPQASGYIQNNAVYVEANSTLLVFVSSWLSSIVPVLTASAITLATYPISQQLLRDSRDGKHDRLPTSFQLSIAIRFVNGSVWASLWGLLRYNTRSKKPIRHYSTALTSVAAVTVIMVILGITMLVADTWLHLTTESVNVVRVTRLSMNEALYSVGIQPQCTSTNNSYTALEAANLDCTVTTRLTGPAIANGEATLQTLNNRSSLFAILRYSELPEMQYLSPVPGKINASHDYTASTFAAKTLCKPISQQCDLILNNNATFNCSNGAFFSVGDYMSVAGVGRQSYRYPDMSDFEDYLALDGVANPFYTAGAAMNQLSIALSPEQQKDPELAVANDTLIAAVFFCNTTVFDVEYDVSQGRISRFATQPSNVSVTNMFASAVAGTSFGSANARIAMEIAAPRVFSAQDYADAFADSLTAIALAGGAASVRLAPIVSGETRNTLLVSQVLQAPLYFLVGVSFSFVLLGLILMVLATLTDKAARAVQFRLSIAGIIANLFEGSRARAQVNAVEQLFSEYQTNQNDIRIKMQRTSKGGFVFRGINDNSEASINDSSPICYWI